MKSTWVYTSAASCSVCCTKAGSIQRTSYKRGESSKIISQREIPAATCLSNTTAERGRISYPRGLQQSQPPQYLSHYSAESILHVAYRQGGLAPTAVTTGTLFITLTKVQSNLHADYHQGGLYSFIATYSLLKLDSMH